MTSVALPTDHGQSFDFRSSQFAADAQTLARATGLSLGSCRQELFISEGDMAMAFELLTIGYDAEPSFPQFH